MDFILILIDVRKCLLDDIAKTVIFRDFDDIVKIRYFLLIISLQWSDVGIIDGESTSPLLTAGERARLWVV